MLGLSTKSKIDRYLNDQEGNEIAQTLVDYVGIDQKTANQFVADIRNTGEWSIFAIGSLKYNPHDAIDAYRAGYIKNFKRGPYVLDSYDRGTPEYPGVTLGALENDNASKLYGTALTVKSTKRLSSKIKTWFKWRGAANEMLARERGQDFKTRTLNGIKRFVARETSKGQDPCYKFMVVDVVTKFGITKALLCGSASDHPRSIGDKMSLEEKAYNVATAIGVMIDGKPAVQTPTSLAYWRKYVHESRKNGEYIEPEIMQLLKLANFFRACLSEKERTRLEKFERAIPGMDKLGRRVLKTAKLSPEKADAIAISSRQKLREIISDPENKMRYEQVRSKLIPLFAAPQAGLV